MINQFGLALSNAPSASATIRALKEFLIQAKQHFEKTLTLDTENLLAHYNLALIDTQLGDEQEAAFHRKEHEKYRPDDNARDRAVTNARRRDHAADHAAQALVIYPLQRAGAL